MIMISFRKVKKVLFAVTALMLIGVFAIFLTQCSEPGEKLRPEGIWLTNSEVYETDLGILKGEFLLQNGNRMRNGKIVSGAVYMDSEKAVEIKENMDVVQTEQKLDVEITLLQNYKTGEWLATQGWLGIKNGNYVILDNTRVKVIGGKKKAISINGKPYANIELVARNKNER